MLTATITAADPSATPPTDATLTLTGLALTTADVTITLRALDTGDNRSPDFEFVATVTNTVPTIADSIPGQTVAIGEMTELSLADAGYFSDTAPGDSNTDLSANLTFSASSSDTSVVKTPTVDPTSKVLILEVPSGVADKATATITVAATDESGKTATQTFVATAALRPVFASSTYSANLAENDVGSTTAVELTELILDTTKSSSNPKSYKLVSVSFDGGDIETSGDDGDDFAKFYVNPTTAEVAYIGDGEDYETLKAEVLEDCTPSGTNTCEPTFELVIGVTDLTNLLEATDTATVTVTDVNDKPTYVSQTLPSWVPIPPPASPILLEKLAASNANPRLLTTLAFADEDATDTSLTYSLVSVTPSSLGAGNFKVIAKSGSPLEAELSFLGDNTVIDHDSLQSFTATVRAVDDDNDHVDRMVTVTVQENIAPEVAVIVAGTPTLQAGSTLTLNADAVDANTAAGDTLTYLWSVASATGTGAATTDITLSTPTTASTTLTVPTKPADTEYVIRVAVTDLVNAAVTEDFSFAVVSGTAPTFTTAVAAQSFPAQLAIDTLTLPAASGGSGTLTYSLTAAIAAGSMGELASNLPAGLTFDEDPATRQLTGTPTAAAVGAYDMTYKVVDAMNEAVIQSFRLTVPANQPPVFSEAARAQVEAGYTFLVSTAIADEVLPAATGGEGDLEYSLTATSDSNTAANINADNLPVGLEFDEDSRTLSGTPTAVDDYSLIYKVVDGDSNTVAADTATIAFEVAVQADLRPMLASATPITDTGLRGRSSTMIDLPVASGGNGDLTDSLSGDHTPVSGSAAAVTVDATTGAISLTGGAASGLMFTPMGGSVATITGTPAVAGTFDLTYTVVDSDNNTRSDDKATVSVTLTVVEPTLSLTGGNVVDGAAAVLEQGVALSMAPITLPRVTSGATAPANISYALTTVPTGLTYTADDGTNAGKLSGTPSAAGTWTLTYTATDNNGTADTGDDAVASSISFTVAVVADAVPDLADARETALGGESFFYLIPATVGANSSTAFALPAFTGGNDSKTQSLTTTCALSGDACAADAVTTLNNNQTPKGLAFAAAAGANPAGLTGTFGSPGTYSLTYSVTDTAIANTQAYQPADDADSVSVTFTLVAEINVSPTLASTTAFTANRVQWRQMSVAMPVASGNFDLTDSLSGEHEPGSGGIRPQNIVVNAASGAIRVHRQAQASYPNFYKDSGLTFNGRTSSKPASITGTPSVDGTFDLTYTVMDGDGNTVSVDLTLTVTLRQVALYGGTVRDAETITLKQGQALTVAPITLPRTVGAGGVFLSPANLGYVLKSSQTVDSSGATIGTPSSTTVAASSDALPGLTYTANTGNTAGKLSGTPSDLGTWALVYEVTDRSVQSQPKDNITVTVEVVADSAPDLADTREAELTASNTTPFEYVTGVAVGADSSTAFALPGFTGGSGSITQSLTTSCRLLDDNTANCAASAVDTDSNGNETPAGLIFVASSGTNPAGLTGTFDSSGTYTVTYTVTDTPLTIPTDYQPADVANEAEVEFILNVADDVAPSFPDGTVAIMRPDLDGVHPGGVQGQALAGSGISLPEASSGNMPLTDSLTGMFDPGGAGADMEVSVASQGTILLDSATDSGLIFTGRSVLGAGAVATITGTPMVVGTFDLTYTVVDSDTNEKPCPLPPATPPSDCDTATVSVTLTVQYPEAAKIAGKSIQGDITNRVLDIGELERSSTKTLDLYEYFSPTGGLTFTATSSNEKVLMVSETGGVLTLTAKAAGGTSTVTVTASNAATSTDPSTSFTVMVIQIYPPVFVEGNIETLSRGLTVGESVTVALGDYFSDTETSDANLRYELLDGSFMPQSSIIYQQDLDGPDGPGTDIDVLTATLSDATLTLTTAEAKTKTDVPIRVRAFDSEGNNSGIATFNASVPNTVPTAVGMIPSQTVEINETTALLDLDLTDYFTDAETSDANLSFSVSSSDAAVVSAATVDATSKVLSLTVPNNAAGAATIAVTATDESGKTVTQTFVATAAIRPAFAASSPTTATLAENANGSVAGAPVELTELMVTGSTDAKSYTLVSVRVNDGVSQTSGTDYNKFKVAAKTGAEGTTAEVTYVGTGEDEDYEALKAAVTEVDSMGNKVEPTFELVIGVTDDVNGLMATANTTLTVTVTDENEAPTYVSQTPASPSQDDPPLPTLLEQLAGNDINKMASTDDPRLLATLTFADVDASDTTLTYSVASVDPATLGTGNFSVAANSTNPLKAELSFVGDATVVDYGAVQSFTVKVSASDDGGAQVEQDVTVKVLENVAPTVTVAVDGTPSLKPETRLTLNANATDTNKDDGDVLNYLWSVTSATSVAGATDDDDVAAITNITLDTPTEASITFDVPNKPAGTKYDITVQVTDLVTRTDSMNVVEVVSATYELEIVSDAIPTFGASISDLSFPAQLAIETQTLPMASGGTGTLRYSLTAAKVDNMEGQLDMNNLPDGLAFDPATRTLTGTPIVAAVGVYDMTYKVEDITSRTGEMGRMVDVVLETATTIFQLTVTANQAPVFSQDARASVMGITYTDVVSSPITSLALPVATGGEGDLVYSLTATSNTGTTANIVGGLPAGLSFVVDPDEDTRTLSGTPTAEDAYSLIYAANDSDSNSDSSDTATIAFTLQVVADDVPMLTAGANAIGYKEDQLATTDLPKASSGNFSLTDSLSGKYTPFGTGGTRNITVDMTAGDTFGDISLAGDPAIRTGLKFNKRTPAIMMTPAVACNHHGHAGGERHLRAELHGSGRRQQRGALHRCRHPGGLRHGD